MERIGLATHGRSSLFSERAATVTVQAETRGGMKRMFGSAMGELTVVREGEGWIV
jgi:hypothetical protein